MLPAVNARKLQHQSHFTWQSRYAPRCSGDELPPASWRERASKHRERCPVLQGHRPPRPPHVKYVPKELPTAEQVDLEPLDFLPAPPESLEDDADGDCFGVLSRVELSRYIARRSAILVRTQQSGQGASVESGSDRLEMSTESFCLKEVDIPWKVILDALSFERMQLRRGFSNQWPDALWSPACLNREAVTELECKLTKCIREIEELADAQDCVRSSLQAMPLGVLLRHLLCDARIAVGDLSCAAKALWGAVTPEAGADPLQPPLLIVWENCLNCNYLKAQQCLRFGRLAILAAAQSLVAAQVAKVEAYTEELRHRREAQHVDRARRALRSARSLLRDASRLYKAEMESEKLHLLDHEDEWSLALQCGHLLALQLEAEASRMLECPPDEVKIILSTGIQLSNAIQASSAATARLQRLVFELRCRCLTAYKDLSNSHSPEPMQVVAEDRRDSSQS
ncbi:Protein disulfide isomerase-like 2-1 [Durusdinium trenchii]|uniref:Protein disulfide isomerase-like 2-1 n=2 Tax=Durusdinium trenchii TaxID=1381693 RepID=A0ABP0L1W6_9DINO